MSAFLLRSCSSHQRERSSVWVCVLVDLHLTIRLAGAAPGCAVLQDPKAGGDGKAPLYGMAATVGEGWQGWYRGLDYVSTACSTPSSHTHCRCCHRLCRRRCRFPTAASWASSSPPTRTPCWRRCSDAAVAASPPAVPHCQTFSSSVACVIRSLQLLTRLPPGGRSHHIQHRHRLDVSGVGVEVDGLHADEAVRPVCTAAAPTAACVLRRSGAEQLDVSGLGGGVAADVDEAPAAAGPQAGDERGGEAGAGGVDDDDVGGRGRRQWAAASAAPAAAAGAVAATQQQRLLLQRLEVALWWTAARAGAASLCDSRHC